MIKMLLNYAQDSISSIYGELLNIPLFKYISKKDDNILKNIEVMKSGDGKEWFQTQDVKIIKLIFQTYMDQDKRNILSVILKPMIKEDILIKLKIPYTKGYRKLSQLEKDGFIIKTGYGIKIRRNVLYDKLFLDISLIVCHDNEDRLKFRLNSKLMVKLGRQNDSSY